MRQLENTLNCVSNQTNGEMGGRVVVLLGTKIKCGDWIIISDSWGWITLNSIVGIQRVRFLINRCVPGEYRDNETISLYIIFYKIRSWMAVHSAWAISFLVDSFNIHRYNLQSSQCIKFFLERLKCIILLAQNVWSLDRSCIQTNESGIKIWI